MLLGASCLTTASPRFDFFAKWFAGNLGVGKTIGLHLKEKSIMLRSNRNKSKKGVGEGQAFMVV
jgi:hypothetical protein